MVKYLCLPFAFLFCLPNIAHLPAFSIKYKISNMISLQLAYEVKWTVASKFYNFWSNKGFHAVRFYLVSGESDSGHNKKQLAVEFCLEYIIHIIGPLPIDTRTFLCMIVLLTLLATIYLCSNAVDCGIWSHRVRSNNFTIDDLNGWTLRTYLASVCHLENIDSDYSPSAQEKSVSKLGLTSPKAGWTLL